MSFVIKYDKGSMVHLVQCIEHQPAIYDSKNHYTKDEQDAAWDEVAKAVGEKDSLCRDRWHSIKSCYIRHLKYTVLNSRRRPYYLADHLDFLLPHVVDRVRAFLNSKNFQEDNLPIYLREAMMPRESAMRLFNARNSNGKDIVIKEEIVDVEEVSDSSWLSVTPDIVTKPSSSKKGTKAKKLPAKRVSSSSSSSSSPKKSKTLKVGSSCKPQPSPPKLINQKPEDDDVKFFKSLMPEIKLMSSHQKLKFKQEALSIIEDILYATEEVNVTDFYATGEVNVTD